MCLLFGRRTRYKDKEGNWQGTNSLSLNEIPKAMLALQKAYAYILEKKSGKKGSKDRSNVPAPLSADKVQ